MTALETKFCSSRRISRRSERTASEVGAKVSFSPFARAIGANSISSCRNISCDREIGDLRLGRAGVEPGNVEQRAEDFLDRLQRGVDVAREADALLRAGLGRALGQRTRIEPRGVERLQDVVAGGGEKARLGEIGVLGGGLGARELLVETLEFGGALLHAPLQPLVGGGELLLGGDALGHVGVGRHDAAVGQARRADLDHALRGIQPQPHRLVVVEQAGDALGDEIVGRARPVERRARR